MALALIGCAFFVATAAPADDLLDQALDRLTEQLAESPRDASLVTDYANLLVRAGEYDAAAAHYQRALDLEPDSITALYNLGLLEFERGRIRAAGQLFRRALAIDEDFARGHYALGTVLVSRARHRRAVQHYATAFSLEPGLLDIKNNPELLYNRLATWASMQSYLTTSLGRGTRLYNDPRPILSLLMPELGEARKAEEAAVDEVSADEAPSEEPEPDPQAAQAPSN